MLITCEKNPFTTQSCLAFIPIIKKQNDICHLTLVMLLTKNHPPVIIKGKKAGGAQYERNSKLNKRDKVISAWGIVNSLLVISDVYSLLYIYLYQFRNNDVRNKTEWQEHYLMPSWSLVNGIIDDDDWHRVVQEERSRASPPYLDHLSLGHRLFRSSNAWSKRNSSLINHVYFLAALGKNKENTSELYLLSSNVRNYIYEFIHKLDAKNRTESHQYRREKRLAIVFLAFLFLKLSQRPLNGQTATKKENV